MSRALNIRLAETEVIRQCVAAGVGISATEALPSGGTRLVCTTGDGADEIRLRFKKHLIPEPVARTPFYGSRARG